MPHYAYLRVSTAGQDTENQRFEVLKFADQGKFTIAEWVVETASGMKPVNERQLGGLLDRVTAGDVIVTTEISRLGRSIMEVMGVLNLCLERKVSLLTTKERFILDTGLNSKIMAFCFSLAAEVERQLISQRTKESLARLKSEGVKLGRKRGSISKSRLDGKEAVISELLAKKVPKASIAKILGVHPGTVEAFIVTRKIKPITTKEVTPCPNAKQTSM